MAIALGVRSTKKARRSALGRDVAMTLAATEYDRVVTVFEECTTEQWEMREGKLFLVPGDASAGA